MIYWPVSYSQRTETSTTQQLDSAAARICGYTERVFTTTRLQTDLSAKLTNGLSADFFSKLTVITGWRSGNGENQT